MGAEQRLGAALDEHFEKGQRRFEKLSGSGQSYVFSEWTKDRVGRLCLYYEFPSRDGDSTNRKRIPVDELLAALKEITGETRLTRTAFRRVCPVAESDGPCGFTVAGRCLELLGIARYSGRQDGFELVDMQKASELLT